MIISGLQAHDKWNVYYGDPKCVLFGPLYERTRVIVRIIAQSNVLNDVCALNYYYYYYYYVL